MLPGPLREQGKRRLVRIKETAVYTFDELSDAAKERAREWRRRVEAEDFDADMVIDDAVRMGELLGIEFATRAVPLHGGGTRREPIVYWSGFCSQGDGACFEGRYRYRKGAAALLRAEAPQDTKLHAFADILAGVQRQHFYRLEANVTHRGRYVHSNTTQIEVYDAKTGDVTTDQSAAETVSETLRGFMDWIYRQLEKEYDYRLSDEAIDETVTANEYEFTEEGKLA
jgi:hypothetical protein